MHQHILVIDDEANMRHLLTSLLHKQGYLVEVAADGAEGLRLVQEREFDFILCDLKMPVMDGMAFLAGLREAGRTATVIMMSAYGTVDQAIETVKQGAYDYISKPFKLDEILLVLRKAEERELLRRENRRLKEELRAFDRDNVFHGMVGTSPAMHGVFNLAAKVAKFDATVLITGESGTGKELIARGIHHLGKGEDVPFIAVNCGGIPADLLESEFFGYVKGAFTGADRDKKGLFESADGGTIFLDEIGELPFELQVKLLRVLQEQEVRRVGAVKAQRIQTRVLAATNRNLEELVKQGMFREDLFYRLNVFNINIPPLREHTEDIFPLCIHFIAIFGKSMNKENIQLAPATKSHLLGHDWPGNVRELKNVIERGVIVCNNNVIMPDDLPNFIGGKNNKQRKIEDVLETFSLKQGKSLMEQRLIRRALGHTKGNKAQAAKILEVSYPSLLAKIKEYGIEGVASFME